MQYEHLLVTVDGPVATVTINRPDKLNALNRATVESLAAAFDDLAAAPEVRAIVLTGSGEKAFVAGADIAEIRAMSPVDALAFARLGQGLMRRIEQSPKPVVAAINGFALGGGCELALACTLRIAGPGARLGLPEVKLGIMPGFGGTQRVARLAGRAAALELALTGEPVDAERARALDLVHRVSEEASPLADARALAAQLAAQAPLAVAHIVAAVDQGLEQPLDQALQTESQLFALLCATEDMREGTQAFLDKRQPRFQGR